ncbi:rRNA maturation RNase YbeY [candidate division KSB1 bacterium]|nr:rRNA maturation RNase YbeY [candidate division KSB1 bacterium]
MPRRHFSSNEKHSGSNEETIAPNTLRLKLPRTVQARKLLGKSDRLVAVLQSLWQERGGAPAEVEIHLVDESTIQQLHRDYLGDPSSTDIITFDLGMSPEQIQLGSLYICPEVAARYAAKFEVTPQQEVQRLAAHGILHLLGYNDLSPQDKRRMRRAENKILARIQKTGL